MNITTICSVCLACSVLVCGLDVFSVVTREGRAHLSDIAWATLFVAIQALVFAWASQDLIAVDEGALTLASVVVVNVACMAAAHFSLLRREVSGKLLFAAAPSDWVAYRVISVPVALIALACAGALCVLAVELPYNYELENVKAFTLFVEWALLTAALIGLYFVGQRRGFLAALVPLASTFVGIAEYFVFLFKGQPLQPGDLLALGTAASVAEGYVYTITAQCLWGVTAGVLALLVCVVLAQFRRRPEDLGGARFSPARRNAGVLANAIAGCAILAAIVSNVTGVDYLSAYQIRLNAWYIIESYTTQAYVPTFIAACQLMSPSRPEGYSAESAEAITASYAAAYDASELSSALSEARAAAEAQFGDVQPSVVVVMNETFADLSSFDGMHAGYEGPEYFNSMGDCVSRGAFYTSVNGGGTTNTEFEFLTGNSMANFAPGVYPYTVYDLTRTDSLPRYFKGLGYSTLAMHPQLGSNWNRVNAYRDLGFDHFLTIDDFEGADMLRGHVTDKATYDKVLELLESNPEPQFIFDVTIQNHSGYSTGLLDEDDMIRLDIDGTSDPLIDEFVSLIRHSDEDLEYFVDQLRELGRPVVLVFFGDHQPYMTLQYNNSWYPDEEDAVHARRVFQTDYVVWANYDVAGSAQESEVADVSASFLGADVLQHIGATLTDYQKAHLELRRVLPEISGACYEDAAACWHPSNQDSGVVETDQARRDFAMMQFFQMFRDGRNIYCTHMQAEPNVAPVAK